VQIPVLDDPETVLTFSDLQDLKIYILMMIVISLVNFGKFLIGFFSNERKDLRNKVNGLEQSTVDVVNKLDKIAIQIAQIKDAQINVAEVQTIARNEMEYRDRLKREP
jgi:hypothetical protein